MSHTGESAKFMRNCLLGQLYEMPDVDHDEANDTDDQDDRASRDNRDPVSRNEYLRPVILPSLAPGTEFLWLTFPPLSSHR